MEVPPLCMLYQIAPINYFDFTTFFEKIRIFVPARDGWLFLVNDENIIYLKRRLATGLVTQLVKLFVQWNFLYRLFNLKAMDRKIRNYFESSHNMTTFFSILSYIGLIFKQISEYR